MSSRDSLEDADRWLRRGSRPCAQARRTSRRADGWRAMQLAQLTDSAHRESSSDGAGLLRTCSMIEPCSVSAVVACSGRPIATSQIATYQSGLLEDLLGAAGLLLSAQLLVESAFQPSGEPGRCQQPRRPRRMQDRRAHVDGERLRVMPAPFVGLPSTHVQNSRFIDFVECSEYVEERSNPHRVDLLGTAVDETGAQRKLPGRTTLLLRTRRAAAPRTSR